VNTDPYPWLVALERERARAEAVQPEASVVNLKIHIQIGLSTIIYRIYRYWTHWEI